MDLNTGEPRTLDIPGGAEGVVGLYEETALVQTDGGLGAYNMDTGTLTQVTDYSVGASEIWEDKVAWVQQNHKSPTGHDRLLMHNLTTNKTHVLVHDEDDLELADADIYEDRIVYMKGSTSHRGWEVWGYNLTHDTDEPLLTGDASYSDQRIAGNWLIALEEAPGTKLSLVAMHIPTGTIETVSGNAEVDSDIWHNQTAFIIVNQTTLNKRAAVRCLTTS